MLNDLPPLGICIPEILLPNNQIDLAKWSVVACDQYTSQPEYWEEVASIVGQAPSTFKLIYPEVYLGKEDGTERIKNIQQTMRQYLQDSILVSQGTGFILVDRQTAPTRSHKGLIVALDLECYDYQKNSQTLIRATEGTVLERIPPRVKIREEATLEIPHIMVLIDDPEQLVIEPLVANLAKLTRVYQTDLMMKGGHITGYKVDDQRLIKGMFKGLQSLAAKRIFHQKYGIRNGNVLLYAVGDGNHSLACAKTVWERLKKDSKIVNFDLTNHPARYALVELVNIHDPGICFEPIHRLVFHVDPNHLFQSMANYYRELGCNFMYYYFPERPELLPALSQRNHQNKNVHTIEFVTAKGNGVIQVHKPIRNLEVGTLQSFLDDYTEKNHDVEVDYIHGADVVAEIASQAGNIGFYLRPMGKSDLFKTVITDGVLPRKTFSMGEAAEKRFYMECRKIS